MDTTTNFKLRLFLAFTGIYIICGTTYLAISFGLQGFPPFILSGLRFFVAGIIILLWMYKKGEKPTSLTNWKKNAVPGILILSAGVGLVAWAEQYVTATEAAIVMAIEPICFMLLARKGQGSGSSNRTLILGLIIGFAGLLLFLKESLWAEHQSEADSGFRIIAFGLLLLSSFLWVLGSLFSKQHPSSHSIFMNVGQQLIIGGIASFTIATATGEWNTLNLETVPLQAWLGLAYLIVFGSLVAYLSFIWLLSVKPPALVSTHTYVNPVVAVFFGWLVAGQFISALQFFGLGIILFGVLLTNFSTYKFSRQKIVRYKRLERVFVRVTNPYRYMTGY